MTAFSPTIAFFDKRKRRTVALALTIALAIIIAFLTLLPVTAPTAGPGTDKAYHVIGFAALTLPCALIYPRFIAVALPGSLLFGIAIELIQPHVGRQGELADFYADVVGALIGVGLGLMLRTVTIVVLTRHRHRSSA